MKFDLLKTAGDGGCSAKLPASELDKALKDLPVVTCDRLIVDIKTHDDAGVYKINDEVALIQTTDFFPPVCSDPYEFGQIAAANALSDVYAMGGEVLTAMNLMMFPANKPMSALKEILLGGQDKVTEAGGVIVGGHTITDDIPKYGLAVAGVVHPDRVITNSAAQSGDKLILTKPIGSGIIMAAKKINEVDEKSYQAVLDSMKTLNKDVSEIMQNYNIKCATDITGFGLLGHSLKLAQASNVSIKIYSASVPLFDNVFDLVKMGCIPGAAFRNQEFVEQFCLFEKNMQYEYKMLLMDAQTSGGMLISTPANKVDIILKELKKSNYIESAIIGEVIEQQNKSVLIS